MLNLWQYNNSLLGNTSMLVKCLKKNLAKEYSSSNKCSTACSFFMVQGIVFSNARLMLPTKKAHMLLGHASKHGKQHVLLEAIFRAYHCSARNINDDSVLVEIAASVGLDPSGARGALHSSEALQDFERACVQSQGKYFIIIYNTIRFLPHIFGFALCMFCSVVVLFDMLTFLS